MKNRKPNTIRALIDAYAAKRLRRKAPNTRLKYGYAVDHWSDQLGREPLLTDLNDDALADYQDYLADLTALADTSVQMYVKKMLALWRYAHCERWVWRWPNVDVIEPADVIPIAWTTLQLPILFAALRRETGYIGCVPADRWWVAFHWMFWNTSERLSTVLGVQWATVDLDSAYVRFPAVTRKGKRRETGYDLSPDCVVAMRAIEQPTREAVFPWPYDRSMIFKRYKRILKDAHLPYDRKHMFHCLRKSVASHMEAAGVDSTDTLGHSSRAVTKKHYLDPRITRPPQPANVLFNPELPLLPDLACSGEFVAGSNPLEHPTEE